MFEFGKVGFREFLVVRMYLPKLPLFSWRRLASFVIEILAPSTLIIPASLPSCFQADRSHTVRRKFFDLDVERSIRRKICGVNLVLAVGQNEIRGTI